MTLTEYIDKVKLETGITYETKGIEAYITDKAREQLKGKNGAIDDETIHKWILEYSDKPKENKKLTEEEIKESEPPVKLAGPTKEVKGSWGTQESLF